MSAPQPGLQAGAIERDRTSYEATFTKTCVLLQQVIDPATELKTGTFATAGTFACDVWVPALRDNPFANNLGGGGTVGRLADRLIEAPVGATPSPQIGDRIAIGGQLYAVQDLAIDESYPLALQINGELIPAAA